MKQVGCIHTCQRLELLYVGVIMGHDYVARNGKLVAFPISRAREDRTIRGCGKWLHNRCADVRHRIEEIIRNTYRTLLTRGVLRLLRRNPLGSRQGMVLLVQHRSIRDPENGGGCTVGCHSSEKRMSDEGRTHEAIAHWLDFIDRSSVPPSMPASKGETVSLIGACVVVAG